MSNLLGRNPPFKLSEVIRKAYQNLSLLESDNYVRKILSLDQDNFHLGINSLTCEITDLNDRKRFDIFILKSQIQSSRLLFSIGIGFSVIEMVTLNLSDPLASRNYYFDTPVPYVLLAFLVPMYMARTESFVRGCRTVTRISIAAIQSISAFLKIYSAYPFAFSSLIVARFLSGPYIIGFLFSCTAIVFSFAIYLLG